MALFLSLLIRNGITFTCVFYGIAANSAEVVAPNDMVECFSGIATDRDFDCQGTSIGTMMALDCCTGNGNTFTYQFQCLGCLRTREVFFSNMKMCIMVILLTYLVIGFNQSELVFTSDDAGRVATIDLIVTKKIPSDSRAVLTVESTGFNKMSQS